VNLLVLQLALPGGVGAQQAPRSAVAGAPAPIADTLKVLVLEGDGAVNNTEKHKGTPPIVEVRDENDRPVEGASVVFRLPAAGPGGHFAKQELSITVRTNIQGQAVASGFLPNSEIGRFKFHVTATAGNKTGESEITQTNSASEFAMDAPPPPKKVGKWKWVAIGAAVAAAAGIGLAASGGASTPTSGPAAAPTITITSGPVTVGGH
jgi:hypothetical protein